MASREVESLDPASLDKFRDELIAGGFSSHDGGRSWIGPIAESIKPWTDATKMTIHVRDGWPFRQPDLIVEGLRGLEHANSEGVICLWQPGDAGRQWMTLDGFVARIDEWSEAQRNGFAWADTTMDAHAYFKDLHDGIAVMDLNDLDGLSDGDRGHLRGRWRGSHVLELSTVGSGDLRGHWFYRDSIDAPPNTHASFAAVLTDEQRGVFHQLTEQARQRQSKDKVALLVWGSASNRNVLALLLARDLSKTIGQRGKARVGEVRVATKAIEFAPDDLVTLKRRAGTDANWLAKYRAVVFGVGAIGSHVALLLAECGLGGLMLVDGDRLRPGNVVRHIAGHDALGQLKTQAVKAVVAQHAPWTRVEEMSAGLWSPEALRRLIKDHDLVIDATGSAGFTEQLARLTAENDDLLVSAALYRSGHVARVRRQGPGDTPIWERRDEDAFPTIPLDPDEEIHLEPGCSSPVANASPLSVVACAAVAAEVALAALRQSPDLGEEIIEVFEALDEGPFDRVGRVVGA